MLDYGVYNVFGRNVEYRGGDHGYEVDTQIPVPVDIIFEVGESIIKFEDIDNMKWAEELSEEEKKWNEIYENNHVEPDFEEEIENMRIAYGEEQEMKIVYLTEENVEQELRDFRDFLKKGGN